MAAMGELARFPAYPVPEVSRTAIVTGGASGIGAAISRRLAADGALVAIFDRDGGAAAAAAAAIEEAGGKASGLPVDVTDRPGVDAGVAEVRARLGRPAILVNNAGISADGPFLDITREIWNRVLAINLTGTFDCCQAVLPGMVDEGWGRIVNISSSSVHSGAPRMAAYVAAKSGVVGLTKALALEFSRHGITVNTIPPGFIDTPMLRDTVRRGFIDVGQQTARTPVGRIGRPEDVAAACAFLVSEQAGYITGQVIGVNGGRNT
jgi:2-hydroxycyclohexanecarboxyl-CoA dehydrogenase